VFLLFAAVISLWPRLLTVPLALFTAWIGAALFIKASRLHRQARDGAAPGRTEVETAMAEQIHETTDREN
jgi:hypothetical protein